MTILVWCSVVNASGGSERVAASLASGLFERGNQVLLVGPFANPAYDLKRRIHPGVTVLSYQAPGGLHGLIQAARFLRSVVRDYNVDLISAHGKILPLIFSPVPVVWTEHSVRHRGTRMFRTHQAPVWWALRSRLLAKRWQVVGVSTFVLKDLWDQMHLPAGWGEVIYNGIPDAHELRGLPAPQLAPPFQIGLIGRLEAEKSPLDVFELSRRVQALGIPCEWHLFGEGELKAEIRARAEAEGEGRIHVHGYVESITDAFRRIDAVVLLSHSEGLPTVVLEARLARRLVFAWDVGGVSEAADGDAFLTEPPFDLDRMAATIAAALRNPQLPRPCSQGCDFSEMVTRYTRVFELMAAPASGRG